MVLRSDPLDTHVWPLVDHPLVLVVPAVHVGQGRLVRGEAGVGEGVLWP